MKKKWYQIKAEADKSRADIYFYGEIVSEKWDESEITAKDFIDKLNVLDVDDIDLYMSSAGGAVFPAVAIYNALLRHRAQVHVHIDGVAASAASMIAMAGDLIEMAENASFMIHNPWLMLMVAGDANDIKKASEQTLAMLESVKESMLNAYVRHSKLSREEIAKAMDDETWYTAQQAVDAGFVDEIFTGQKIAACIQAGRYKRTPVNLLTTSGRLPVEDDVNVNPQGAGTAAPPDPKKTADIEAAAAKRALEADKKRRGDIAALYAKHPAQAELMRQCQDDMNCTEAEASRRLIDALGAGTGPIGGTNRIETGEDEFDKFKRGAVAGLVARAERKPGQGEIAAEFRYVTFRQIAARCLQQVGMSARDIERMRPRDMYGMVISHTTSDFPNILEDTMHKMIVSGYRAFADTWRRFCKIGEVSDFRIHKRLKLGSFNNIVAINEAGEYQQGTIPDAEKENQQADTKGREIRISRQMLINDDLSVFSDLGTQMGRAAARTVEADVYAVIAANPTMSDGTAFFHADHANLASSGAVPSVGTLAAGETAMRSQTDPGGNEFIDVRPKVFVGGIANARLALEIIGSEYTPETASSAKAQQRRNALFGMIDTDNIIGTPRLVTPWYLFADPMEAPAIEVAFLDGVQEPAVDQFDRRNPDGISLLVRHDYGVAAIDWRGAWKDPGT